MSIQYYPVDFDAIRKGQKFTTEELETITGQQAGTDKFKFAVLSLRDRIMRECRERNNVVTVAIIKQELLILTDEQAAIYNAKHVRSGFRRSRRSHRRLTCVDTSQLSELQRKEHERNVLTFGRMLAAARKARKVDVLPHARRTPAIERTPVIERN